MSSLNSNHMILQNPYGAVRLQGTKLLALAREHLGEGPLADDAYNFVVAKLADNKSKHTIRQYTLALGKFVASLRAQGVTQLTEIRAPHLRKFLIELKTAGYNPGGVHHRWMPVKIFIRWWRAEQPELCEHWPNPLDNIRVSAPKGEPIQPVSVAALREMVNVVSKGHSMMEDRDRCILLVLFDSGPRASELLNMNIGDVHIDDDGGQILIMHGKGGKTRLVPFGKETRKELTGYLRRHRKGAGPKDPLFVSQFEEKRLTYAGLRQITRRAAEKAGLPREPGLHNFRRACAINLYRNGTEIIVIQRILGHSDDKVIRRYLAFTGDDIREAHRKASPVDMLL